jgi:hypothetical protein
VGLMLNADGTASFSGPLDEVTRIAVDLARV